MDVYVVNDQEGYEEILRDKSIPSTAAITVMSPAAAVEKVKEMAAAIISAESEEGLVMVVINPEGPS